MNYILTKEKLADKFISVVPTLDEVFDKIREALKQKGFTQKKLAERLGVSEPTVSRVMAKKRGLSVEMLIEIAEILEIDPASLVPGINPEKRPALDEYIRQIVQEEIEKALKKK